MATTVSDLPLSAGLSPLAEDQEGSAGLWEMVRIALDSLSANKMRSLLTMLGVIIGVTSVVALLSLGDGVNNAITGQLKAMGTNVLFISPTVPKGVARDFAARPFLTQADAEAITSLNLPLIGIAPQFMFSTRVTAPAADADGTITATTPDWFKMGNMKLVSGSFWGEEELRTAAPVFVIGANLKKALFGSGQAVGQTVRVRGIVLRVVGVLELQGGMNTSQDDGGYVPITLAQQRLGIARTPSGNFSVGQIIVSAKDGEDLSLIQARISTLLRERHHLKFDGSGDDFRIDNFAAIIQQASTILGALTIFLGAVAGISLLVGGIGIMNIMLVSVTERTKEIGLRKAVGARGLDILFQFIVEALVISLTGGLIGLGLGSLIAFAVTTSGQLFDAPVTPGAIILALGFSMAVGLFFGIYPAQRAARLNPIDALRFE